MSRRISSPRATSPDFVNIPDPLQDRGPEPEYPDSQPSEANIAIKECVSSESLPAASPTNGIGLKLSLRQRVFSKSDPKESLATARHSLVTYDEKLIPEESSRIAITDDLGGDPQPRSDTFVDSPTTAADQAENCNSSVHSANGISPTNKSAFPRLNTADPEIHSSNIPSARLCSPAAATRSQGEHCGQKEHANQSPDHPPGPSSFWLQDEEEVQSWRRRMSSARERMDSVLSVGLYEKVKKTSTKVRRSLSSARQSLTSGGEVDSQLIEPPSERNSQTPTQQESDLSPPSEQHSTVPRLGEAGPVDWDSPSSQQKAQAMHLRRQGEETRIENEFRRAHGDEVVDSLMNSQEYQSARAPDLSRAGVKLHLMMPAVLTRQKNDLKVEYGAELVGMVASAPGTGCLRERVESAASEWQRPLLFREYTYDSAKSLQAKQGPIAAHDTRSPPNSLEGYNARRCRGDRRGRRREVVEAMPSPKDNSVPYFSADVVPSWPSNEVD
ncbi:hypothetical protein BDV97DRAFT_362629 [Delphinella strobiligena]|nr:hypothetical protein BDV97DRAFT_362629 [Delphinella strobiligena]